MTLKQEVPQGKLILHSEAQGYVFVEPGDELTQGLINGMTFVPIAEYQAKHTSVPLSEEDLNSVGFREMTQEEKVQKFDELFGSIPAFTQADVLAKVDEHPKYLDHAFALLGKDMSEPKSARTRFARFVTGDFKDEGKNFRPKSLEHKTAFRCFYRFIKNTEYDSHLELARDIVAENWEDLEELLEAECYSLPKMDDVWLDKAVITNMSTKAFQVEGWGWVPKSKVKFIKGKMVIPSWLAQSILDKKGE